MKKVLAAILTLAVLLTPVLSLAETVTIGVTGAFYDDLWKPAIEALAAEGIQVELIQFSDFALPNNALNGGDISMNAFQHHAYFDNDVATNGYDLQVLADTFVITMNLYSQKYESMEALSAAAAAGTKLTVAVPNDATNYGRSLLLLESAGLLTLGEYEGTPNEENIASSQVELVLVNAAMTYQYLEDVDAAVKAAWGAFPAWKAVEPAQRADLLLKIAYRPILKLFIIHVQKMSGIIDSIHHVALVN